MMQVEQFICPVCGAKAADGSPFCPANSTHSSVFGTRAPRSTDLGANVAPDGDGRVTAKCIAWLPDKVLNTTTDKMVSVQCGELITGTRKEIGGWGTKCPVHRGRTEVAPVVPIKKAVAKKAAARVRKATPKKRA